MIQGEQQAQTNGTGADGSGSDGETVERTMSDEIVSLIEDGQNYFEAELAYQKTRASFVADRAKVGLVLVFGALAFLHLALIALVVGLVFALAPLLGVWGALAIVVGLLLVGVVTMAVMAKNRFGAIAAAFAGEDEQ
ncbi:MAG: phage holin family protein [Sphingomonadales bacterium]|nr:phage holin family protein [Sphingomonadales bacterium]MBD3773282.1 phage holin family protein [Paracoccaceae bacterium]